MKIINFGGGEIWNAIEKLLNKAGIETVSYGRSSCDVGEFEKVEYIMQPADWIIYTAGVSHITSIKDSNRYDFVEEIMTNFIGFYSVVRAGIKQGTNNYIAITSVAGLYGKPMHAGYSASKMALRSFIQSMAMEGYNAYGIAPGRVDTVMREKDFPGEDPKTRLAPKQVAKVVMEILNGKHESGDNVIIRKRGIRTLRRVDNGSPWKEYLNVNCSTNR